MCRWKWLKSRSILDWTNCIQHIRNRTTQNSKNTLVQAPTNTQLQLRIRSICRGLCTKDCKSFHWKNLHCNNNPDFQETAEQWKASWHSQKQNSSNWLFELDLILFNLFVGLFSNVDLVFELCFLVAIMFLEWIQSILHTNTTSAKFVKNKNLYRRIKKYKKI